MKTAELEGPVLDYHVALIMGHVWRRPRVEFEGYNAWQAYEQAFGNPTPPYSTDWAVGGPVIDEHKITTTAYQAIGIWEGFISASAEGPWICGISEGEGATPLIAAMRALIAFHFGQDVPDIPL